MEKPKKKALKIIKRVFIIACLLKITAFASLFAINYYVKAAVKDQIITAAEASTFNADCILVLGAGVINGRPSPMLTDRLLEGINLYKAGASKKLLMSGDHGQKDYDEVNTMKQFAMDYDIPSQDIFMDHAGFSTYESMYRARDIFQAKKIIIVTQEYHLYRALYVANALGLEAYGVPSDPREYYGQEYREAREILARFKDFFMAIFKPLPTYLGEVIPVSGNGDLTND
jgi:vancomycin permeability regulator SanA